MFPPLPEDLRALTIVPNMTATLMREAEVKHRGGRADIMRQRMQQQAEVIRAARERLARGLPMRLSINPDDATGNLAYHMLTPQQRRTIRVFCDGREIEQVITADEEEGTVLAHATDPHTGNILTAGNETVKNTIRGKVRIAYEGRP